MDSILSIVKTTFVGLNFTNHKQEFASQSLQMTMYIHLFILSGQVPSTNRWLTCITREFYRNMHHDITRRSNSPVSEIKLLYNVFQTLWAHLAIREEFSTQRIPSISWNQDICSKRISVQKSRFGNHKGFLPDLAKGAHKVPDFVIQRSQCFCKHLKI